MTPFSSLFSQILKTFPRLEFDQLVGSHRAERHARGFTCWQQFVAMLFCQMGKAQSLREICQGLASAEGKLVHLGIAAPSHSTLAYANKHRPWELFQSVFSAMLERCREAAPGRHPLRFKNPLLSLDATTIDLCAEVFDWAACQRRQRFARTRRHVALLGGPGGARPASPDRRAGRRGLREPHQRR